MNKILISIIIGIALGIIGSRYLFVGSGLSLIPWGIIGFILGWWSKTKKEVIVDGGVYGFFLAFSFMLSGYDGKASIITRIPPFVIVGLVGAVCGLILAFIGYICKKSLGNNNNKHDNENRK